jgi:hypothetical protein
VVESTGRLGPSAKFIKGDFDSFYLTNFISTVGACCALCTLHMVTNARRKLHELVVSYVTYFLQRVIQAGFVVKYSTSIGLFYYRENSLIFLALQEGNSELTLPYPTVR